VLKANPVVADAVRLFTPETRAYIESVYGDAGFMVRKDMLNDAVGYRSASISDIWTGNSKINPEMQKHLKTLTTGIFGKDAYRMLVNSEKIVKGVAAEARVTVVVRSVVVPVANLLSNVVHLTAVGVPITEIVRGMTRKAAEIEMYARTNLEKIDLEAELRAAENNIVLSRKLRLRIKAIEDSHRRLSIWPLIERGEFSSINEAAIRNDDQLLLKGRLGDYIETQVDKLPASVKTAGRYAVVTKDTALFQGLQKAVEYGDFLAKAVLYDDLTKRKKVPVDEALGRISEEFINFDRLPGRTRGYLEDMGLLWFWNFKVRAVKVAISTLQNNPLQALLAGIIPTPDLVGSIGTPVSDNLFAVAADNRLGYSIGPGQAFSSISLNPWVNLFN